ncbi:hypothetical protein [Peribacillus simplex]|uniref:hypothetical protein n=1 Tax=Peribacillus simplex TaxID=1478 RepID=UPI0011A7E946|nr:hypothetical protein [Peribacillus simplex]
MERIKDNLNNNEKYENQHPELKKEDRFTSPASSLPLYELKMLQEYIHGENLQNLGSHLPHYKKQMMLLKFFKYKKNQLVEVFSRNGDEVIQTVGKVNIVGRNFVMLKTLFTRIWIPYHAIHSAKTPFGIPDLPGGHQHVIYDEELRRKLLTNFGDTVSSKEILKQQFFEESLDTNLKTWQGTRFAIYADKLMKGKVVKVLSEKIYIKSKKKQEISINKINYMKQGRFISFFQRFFSNSLKKKNGKMVRDY